MESKAVGGTGIVGTGITEGKKIKKLTERMAENLRRMVRNLLCGFFVPLENKLVVVILCSRVVCFVPFLVFSL